MPPVTRALLVANVAVFLLQLGVSAPLFEWFALWPLSSAGPLEAPSFQVWQLVTYGFLHGSVAHVAFNMLALYMFGGDIERLFGSRFFLRYFLASVVAGALTHLVVTGWTGAPPHPTVGASGGIYGVLLAYGLYFPRRIVMLVFPPIPMPALLFVAVYATLELYYGVTGTREGVAHFAHLGGMLGGWIMIQYRRGGFPFKRRR
ncbi:MAG: rhomboid family intramembrane serine protease [Betaproteobacteria bacterium RIFCSPHIGHO2_12_FULL_69_13]|nr:MAG: rhomboid family intramembrane serine protease [Betaproteobacteria bacterium RIFCSPHIGHO2_12_FULL_69_13]OGA64490.1 MAG: rhomboid family intramembrane serine protease [Betaproteobacteria bacterium RIFCSPLOWO2_12_FULL_68_20]